MSGRQVKINRSPIVGGIPMDQFIEENADPLWLHQNEMWELIPVEASTSRFDPVSESLESEDENGAPFTARVMHWSEI